MGEHSRPHRQQPPDQVSPRGERPSIEQPRLRRRRRIYATIPRSLLRDSSISTGARLLYATLDDYANGSDDAPWPSQETLAGHLGVTDRCVRNWLNELARTGWIEVEHRPGSSSLHWLNDDPAPRNESSGPPRNESSGPPRNHGSDEEEPLEEEPLEEAHPPATPPAQAGGDDDPPSLFADPVTGGASARSETRRRARGADVHPLARDQHDVWLKHEYPTGASGGGDSAKAFARCLDEGVPVSEIERQTRNYRRGLQIWAETFGEPRRPMSASRFLALRGRPDGGKRLQWDQASPDEVTLEFCRDVIGWPPPDGRTWERPKRRAKLSELGVGTGG